MKNGFSIYNFNMTIQNNQPLQLIKSLILMVIFLIACYLLWQWIDNTEPEVEQVGATKKSAIPVELAVFNAGDYRPTIKALARVIPARDLTWTAQVAGEIINRSPKFEPGILVQKGQLLIKIEDRDFKLALQEAESEVNFAAASARVEEGNQLLVKEQVKMYDEKVPKEDEEFMFRIPQLLAAKSKLEQAKAKLNLARLNLERTTFKAPFTSLVMERKVETGKRIAVGQELGYLVDVTRYWLKVSLPIQHLRWIDGLGTQSNSGAKVIIKDKVAWGEQTREGRVLRKLGTLEEKTRLAQLLVEVEDPLALNSPAGTPNMILESIVQVEIEGSVLKQHFRIPRFLLRKNNTLWVSREDKLQIISPKITMMDTNYAYIHKGLLNNEKVIHTNLSRVSEGLPLKGSEIQL